MVGDLRGGHAGGILLSWTASATAGETASAASGVIRVVILLHLSIVDSTGGPIRHDVDHGLLSNEHHLAADLIFVGGDPLGEFFLGGLEILRAGGPAASTSGAGGVGFGWGGTGEPCGRTNWMADPVTAPLVEGVQPSTSNLRFSLTGELMKPTARSLAQPARLKSQGSLWAFFRPNPVNSAMAQATAASSLGEPVTRGP